MLSFCKVTVPEPDVKLHFLIVNFKSSDCTADHVVLFCDLNNEPKCGCVEIILFVPDTSCSPKPAIHTL